MAFLFLNDFNSILLSLIGIGHRSVAKHRIVQARDRPPNCEQQARNC
mgnify:CR=1 FL=1